MGILRHLDKAICGVLILLTLWYAWARFSGFEQLRQAHGQQIQKADVLATFAAKNVRNPPQPDAAAYSLVPMRRWDQLPKALDYQAWNFYPSAPQQRTR